MTSSSRKAGRVIDHRYFRTFPVLGVLALAAMVSGLAYQAAPDALSATVLGKLLPAEMLRVWALIYCGGSFAILLGFYLRAHHASAAARWEAFGCCLLSSCYLSYVVAVQNVRGFAAGVVVVPVFLALAIGFAVRAFLLTRPAR